MMRHVPGCTPRCWSHWVGICTCNKRGLLPNRGPDKMKSVPPEPKQEVDKDK